MVAAVSALSGARSAIDSAASRLEASSQRVADMLPRALEAFESVQTDPQAEVGEGVQAPPESSREISLEREFVEQTLALVQGLAGMRVAETEFELLGALVDLRA